MVSRQWHVVMVESVNLESEAVLRTAPAAAACFDRLSKSDSGSAHFSDVVSGADMLVAIAIADYRLGNTKESHHSATSALALLNAIQNDHSGSHLAQVYAVQDRKEAEMLLAVPLPL
jgi:hypothetical protein